MKTMTRTAVFMLAFSAVNIATCFRTTIADVFSIPNPENTASGLPRPARGMTMEQVLVEFGPPLEKTGPVGKPPITRWIYSDFIVNFEKEWVIHSGVKRR